MQAGIPFYEIPARLLVFKEALPPHSLDGLGCKYNTNNV